MSILPPFLSLLAISGASLAMLTAASGETLYQQGFANNSKAGVYRSTGDPLAYGWADYYGATATTGNWLVYANNGSTAMPNVNAPTPYGNNITQGYWGNNNNVIRLAVQSLVGQPIVLAHYSSLTFSVDLWMDQGVGKESIIRFAMQIGSNWYVTQESIQPTSTSWETWSLNLSSETQLLALSFTPGSELAISDTPAVSYGSLSDQQLLAIGCFTGVGSNPVVASRRMDNFAVYGTAIPEPSGLSTAGIGAAALGFSEMTRRGLRRISRRRS